MTRNPEKVQQAAAEMLRHLGIDPLPAGMKNTPDRVARMWLELTAGYDLDPGTLLKTSFDADGYDQMIVMRGIDFSSTCEHHLLPFIGRATVGYLPGEDGRVVGASKLARVVDCFARRFQIQERMTKQIADAVEECLNPRAVGVVLVAGHECMACRGVRKPRAEFVTSALRGAFRSDPSARAEFLAFHHHGRQS